MINNPALKQPPPKQHSHFYLCVQVEIYLCKHRKVLGRLNIILCSGTHILVGCGNVNRWRERFRGGGMGLYKSKVLRGEFFWRVRGDVSDMGTPLL